MIAQSAHKYLLRSAKRISRGINRRLRTCVACCESIEQRQLLSGSNAIDELDFGNLSSEASHDFEPGYTATQMPLTGTGALSQTYREPFGLGDNAVDGPQSLTFTLSVDPARQNYLTIKLWGSDVDGGTMYLAGTPFAQTTPVTVQDYDNGAAIDQQGGAPAFPGRFFYYTVPIAESLTLGKTSTQLTLDFISYYDFYGGTGYHYLSSGQLTRPVYAVYCTTDPHFTPDPNAPTGSAPAQTTTTLSTLTAAKAQSILSSVFTTIYGSGGYYSTVTAEQILSTDTTAPPEVMGLDLFTNVASYNATDPSAEQWRDTIAGNAAGRGYTSFPDELLSVLSSTYLTPTLSYSPSTEVSAYHGTTVLADIVSAMDGASYMQGSDGGFPTAGSGWIGLTSTARTSGPYAGLSVREPTTGEDYLEGIDVATLGETIVNLLDDPTGGPAFTAYLAQSYDANLDGSQMLRAYAYERMLFNSIGFFQNTGGGTSSQAMFQTLGIYADQVALEKLQTIYPNAAYPALPAALGFYYAQQAMGLAPTTLAGHHETNDYALSSDGLGEPDGTYDGGYDGGYGQYFPELTPYFSDLAADDPGITAAQAAQIASQADNSINSFNEFISSGSNVTFNSSGGIVTDAQELIPENFITYRNTENPNYGTFNVDSSYLASDPNGPMKDADALRSAYLETQYGITPDTGYSNDGNASLNFIRLLGAYENTINSLINNTSTLPLPGEPGQTNFAFADVQTGSVAFINNGERFYMNMNWRRNEDEVNDYARIHDTTGTVDLAATIMMPYDGTTVQPDGNLSGNFNSPWVVRYGDYLIVLNHSNLSDEITLPSGTGLATDLISGLTYAMGSSLSVAAGQAVILNLSTPEATNLAGVSTAASQGSAPALQTAASMIAGYSSIDMLNNQIRIFTAEVLNSSGQPLNYVPTVTWTLQSGSLGTITPDGTYTAPATGIGTATVIATDGSASTSFVVTIVPFIGPGRDIGTVGVSGSDSYSSGTYTLTGAGAGLASSVDAFHMLPQRISGDASIVSQVTSQSGANASSGVMIRDNSTVTGTNANSSFAAIVYTGAGTLVFDCRATDGANLSSVSVPSPSTTPYLEITRSGNSFSAYYSTNGTSWTQLGSAQTLTLATLAQVGLIVDSGSTTQVSTATFKNTQIIRTTAEYPSFTINPAVALFSGTTNQIKATVTAADGSANTALSYQWWVVGWPANGPVTVNGQGSTSATVYFTVYEAGTYVFAVKVTDAYGLSVIGTASVNMTQTLTILTVTDPKQYVAANAAQQISVQAYDQYGYPMTTPSITWSVTGGGSITSAGVCTAPSSSAISTVTAIGGGITGSATVGSTPLTTAGVDVGSVAIAGGENYMNGTYTVTGSGAGISGTLDAFHLLSSTVTGSFSFTSELDSQSASNLAAGAGVMIRSGTAANAIFAGVIDSPISGDGLLFDWRTTAGGAISWVAAPTPSGSAWLRLTNSAGMISAYYSTNDTAWTQLGTNVSLTLGNSPQVGLAVTSASNNSSTAVFSNVSIVQSTGPTATTNATATVTGTSIVLLATGSDPAGASTLAYSWSAVGNTTTGVTFSASGTDSAKNTTATFTAAGTYDLRVVATDALGLSAVSDIVVTVVQTLASIKITPGSLPTTLVVTTAGTYQYAASADDQFGNAMTFQPGLSWLASAGSINLYTGVFTAPATAQTVTLSATNGSVTGTLAVVVKSLGIFADSQDVGSPANAGSTNYSAGIYTVAGSGSDIWSSSDQFQFVYEQMTGDGTIEARVVSLQNTQSAGHSKAGIMIRNTLAANSAFADAVLTYDDGVEYDYRTTASGGPYSAGSVAAARGPYWVELTRTGNVFEVQVAPDDNGTPGTWTVISSTISITMNQTIYAGLCVTSANTAALNTAVIDNVSVTSQARTFTNNQDIGQPPFIGSYDQNSGVVMLTGCGLDIWNTSDQFQFAYVPITGNVTIIARVVSIPSSGSTPNAKAGVMIRNTLAAGSIMADAVISPNDSARFDYRTTANVLPGEALVSSLSIPYWVKLVRTGNSFAASISSNGTTWTSLGSAETIAMDSTVYVGLVVTSCNTSELATATFDNISVTGAADAAPTVATAAAASSSTVTGTSVNLSVLGADADGGGESNLSYTWTATNAPAAGAGSVSFSSNGTNASKATTAAFTQAGSYVLQVAITDQGNLSITSDVIVTVNQTFTSVSVTPASPIISPLGTQMFTATALDQFGNAAASQPVFIWSVTGGGGTISGGNYTAPLTGSTATVQASSGSISGSATVTITNQPPLVANSIGATATLATGTTANLSVTAVDDSGQSNLTYTWSAISPSLPVTFSVNGTNAAQNTAATFSAIGIYTLQVTITDPGGLSTTSLATVTIGTILGTSGNDTIRLVRSGANLDVYINSVTVSYTVAYASLGAITVAGGSGNDTVNVDFSGGASPVPSAGLTVNGSGGVDMLVITGTTGADTTSINANTITLNGSAITYADVATILIDGNGGADSLTQTAQPGNSASLAFNGDTSGGLSSNDTLADSGGDYSFAAPTSGSGISVISLASLSISNGAAVLLGTAGSNSDRYVLVLGSLAIVGSGSTLDLGGNDMIVDNGSLAAIDALAATGYNGGQWNGPGLASTAGHNNSTHLTALAMGLDTGSSFDKQPVTISDVLVKYTSYGDANLDGAVDGSDYTKIDNGFNNRLTGWSNGDFNYDGVIDGSDYTLIDNAYNMLGGGEAALIAASPAAIIARPASFPTRRSREIKVVMSCMGIADDPWVVAGEGFSQPSIMDDLLPSTTGTDDDMENWRHRRTIASVPVNTLEESRTKQSQ